MPADTIKFCTIESGSSGNCVYCETTDGAILIDAGISCKKIEAHLNKMGINKSRIAGLILTHSHSDHIKGAGPVSRNLQKPGKVPVFMTSGTYYNCSKKIGAIPYKEFKAGASFSFGGFSIETFPTPHDVEGSIALILQRGNTRIGIFTDLGHSFDKLKEALPTLDAVLIESNYEPKLLDENPQYPYYLKDRIKGSGGHLSNEESALLIKEFASEKLKAVMLGHLSKENNCPELALDIHRRIAGEIYVDRKIILEVAPRYSPSKMIAIKNIDSKCVV
jgi:phosphoribosyl 1,2-cyclic phosphodiesterase